MTLSTYQKLLKKFGNAKLSYHPIKSVKGNPEKKPEKKTKKNPQKKTENKTENKKEKLQDNILYAINLQKIRDNRKMLDDYRKKIENDRHNVLILNQSSHIDEHITTEEF